MSKSAVDRPASVLANSALHEVVEQLAQALRLRGSMMASAESCTGGMIAAACTDLAGSSDWFERGFVTYSNTAKTELLGVPQAQLRRHGAVSEAVARAMALGAVAHSRAQVSVAVTGVAGPAGGNAEKPVGTVWFGWCVGGQASTEMVRFEGDRAQVRSQTVRYALAGLLARLGESMAASKSGMSAIFGVVKARKSATLKQMDAAVVKGRR